MLRTIKNTLSRHLKSSNLTSTHPVFKEFVSYNEINIGNCSHIELVALVNWCFTLTRPNTQQLTFFLQLSEQCDALNYSQEAYRLLVLVDYWQPNASHQQALSSLSLKVLDSIKVGVAVITYNRAERLVKCVKALSTYSPNVELVVADDGSEDETVAWCRDHNVACMTAENSGVVANKNRALYYLHEVKRCDVSILLEDDCLPISVDWYHDWALSALAWGHINYAHQRILDQKEKLVTGFGTIQSPYLSELVTGQCTATSLLAFNKIGYLNPIFKGYGCGHVEWTERFLRAGFHPHTQLTHKPLFACINSGIRSEDAPTFKSQQDIDRNRSIKKTIQSQPAHFQPPWQSETERKAFIEQFRAAQLVFTSVAKPQRERSRLEHDGNFFFVHLSKTAGTSFRQSVEKNYPVWKDYGNKVSHTSEPVQRLLYDANDIYPLKKEFQNQKSCWITGHVPLAKYSDLVSTRSIITFVREPISQILSHYNHFVTHHKFKGDLDTFLKRPAMVNFQSKHLAQLPLGLIGYIGLTEEYTESVGLINDFFQLEIDVQHINKNPTKSLIKEALSNNQSRLITELNQGDISMYCHATWLYQQRKKLTERSDDWTYSHLEINRQAVLTGCAYFAYSDEPVKLLVYKNGAPMLDALATSFYHAYAKVNFPRKRYIGINIPLKNSITSDDQIDVYVEKTGQKLTYAPLTTFKPKQ
jgi:hypothetical protein